MVQCGQGWPEEDKIGQCAKGSVGGAGKREEKILESKKYLASAVGQLPQLWRGDGAWGKSGTASYAEVGMEPLQPEDKSEADGQINGNGAQSSFHVQYRKLEWKIAEKLGQKGKPSLSF